MRRIIAGLALLILVVPSELSALGGCAATCAAHGSAADCRRACALPGAYEHDACHARGTAEPQCTMTARCAPAAAIASTDTPAIFPRNVSLEPPSARILEPVSPAEARSHEPPPVDPPPRLS
jgi:hypothetical protein